MLAQEEALLEADLAVEVEVSFPLHLTDVDPEAVVRVEAQGEVLAPAQMKMSSGPAARAALLVLLFSQQAALLQLISHALLLLNWGLLLPQEREFLFQAMQSAHSFDLTQPIVLPQAVACAQGLRLPAPLRAVWDEAAARHRVHQDARPPQGVARKWWPDVALGSSLSCCSAPP